MRLKSRFGDLQAMEEQNKRRKNANDKGKKAEITQKQFVTKEVEEIT